ncbi:hypothetical protein NFA_6990 [Nocardia farcinica IFM 10152]|uniref:Uncharacterized protein n=1 Tax=Nocardia farcinica (strain IFM 10152) TaxID=247156 RepID=Q5Z1Z7_NOCFA|nr:hypothetical protein NFA_6990 [Nocardia farcinica IFM 10152]
MRRGSRVKGGDSHHVVTPQAPLTREWRTNTMQANPDQGHAANGRDNHRPPRGFRSAIHSHLVSGQAIGQESRVDRLTG